MEIHSAFIKTVLMIFAFLIQLSESAPTVIDDEESKITSLEKAIVIAYYAMITILIIVCFLFINTKIR